MTDESNVQASGRWAQTEPDLAMDTPPPGSPLLPTVKLRCLSAEHAQRVADEFPNRGRGGTSNTMTVEGDIVVITYADKMWPYDIADWAGDEGLASDHDAAMVFACI